MENYIVDYTINLGDLYSERFNSLYSRRDGVSNGVITTIKDEFVGYYDYKVCDKNDEISKKDRVRKDLIDFLNNMIEHEELQKNIKNIKCDNYVNKIELVPIKINYKENIEFTLYTRIIIK